MPQDMAQILSQQDDLTRIARVLLIDGVWYPVEQGSFGFTTTRMSESNPEISMIAGFYFTHATHRREINGPMSTLAAVEWFTKPEVKALEKGIRVPSNPSSRVTVGPRPAPRAENTSHD